MKLLTFQAFSIYQGSGSSRIFRRMFQGRESDVHSITITTSSNGNKTGLIKEELIHATPLHRKWMRSFLRKVENWLRYDVFFNRTTKKIETAIISSDFDVLHVLNFGLFPSCIVFLFERKQLSYKSLWVSFHDHYTCAKSSKEHCSQLWNLAERRFVISKEMGEEYQRQFGSKAYEIITDGVEEKELSQPKQIVAGDIITIYFAGLLHLNYLPLFEVLGDALDELSKQGKRIKLLFRGTQKVDFLENRLFQVEYKPFTLDNEALKQELDATDVLYLPIKFTVPNFYLYSLSTKMIGYLGASGTILYHGPSDSAACKLLERTNSAICCTTMNCSDLAKAINRVIDDKAQCSYNSKILAKESFLLQNIQNRFWKKCV